MSHTRSRRPFFAAAAMAAAAMILSIPASRAAGGDSQPDVLRFGPVRVGATVEGSVRIFRDEAEASPPTPKLEPPEFVRVRQVEVGTQNYGGNVKGFCDILVSLDTRRPGTVSGPIRVVVGRRRYAVPVSATIRPRIPRLTRTLVLSSPFTRFSTRDSGQWLPWLELVDAAHLDPHYVEVKPDAPVLRGIDLNRFDAVLLGMDGLTGLTDADVAALRRFTERGGRTIVAASRPFFGTVPKANRLLAPYGLEMRETESRDRPEYRLEGEAIARDPRTEGVGSLSFFRPAPIAVKDRARGRILVAAPGYPGEGFVAAARAGKGEVIAIGEALWWSWLAHDREKRSNNAALLGALLGRPRPGK